MMVKVMIDLKLVKAIIKKYALLLSHDSELSVLSDMQQQPFFTDKATRSSDAAIANFDAFGFAWDRQSRDSKLRILAVAYRSQKHLFDQSDIRFRAMYWEKLNQAQQAGLINASSHLLVTVLKLFADQYHAEQIVSGWQVSMQQKEEQLNKQVSEMVRAA